MNEISTVKTTAKMTKEKKRLKCLLVVGMVSKILVCCRNGVELAPIASDKSYNFNFQETRHLKQERVFTKEDSMQVVCNYKTKNVRLNITLVSHHHGEKQNETN